MGRWLVVLDLGVTVDDDVADEIQKPGRAVAAGREVEQFRRLVDEIGGKKEALAWLVESAEISIDLPIINVTPVDEVDRWSKVFSIFMGKTLFSERLSLDGALSLWHSQLNL